MDDRLLTWARLPGPRKVLAAARRRLEAGHGLGGSPLPVELTPGERSEIGRLLGMSWERSGRAVGAKALAMAVENYGATVTDLLAVIGDPVRDLRAAKESARQNAAAERERAAAALREVGVPATIASAWLDRRSLPAAGNGQLLDLAERCARVWSALPQLESGRILLTVLAATALDDPHALDRGSSIATAVLRLLGHDLPDSADAWRMAWEEHGIDCDPVSSRVLVLNLPLYGDAPCARLAQAGSEPLWLTSAPSPDHSGWQCPLRTCTYARTPQCSSPQPINSARLLVRLSAQTGVPRPPRSACSPASPKAGRQSTSAPTTTLPARR